MVRRGVVTLQSPVPTWLLDLLRWLRLGYSLDTNALSNALSYYASY